MAGLVQAPHRLLTARADTRCINTRLMPNGQCFAGMCSRGSSACGVRVASTLTNAASGSHARSLKVQSFMLAAMVLVAGRSHSLLQFS